MYPPRETRTAVPRVNSATAPLYLATDALDPEGSSIALAVLSREAQTVVPRINLAAIVAFTPGVVVLNPDGE